jgi:nitrogen fixation-related uncharacterized protein
MPLMYYLVPVVLFIAMIAVVAFECWRYYKDENDLE